MAPHPQSEECDDGDFNQEVFRNPQITKEADQGEKRHDESGRDIDRDTAKNASQTLKLPPLRRLPNEIIKAILDTFPADPRLPNLTVTAATSECRNRFRQTTRLSLCALSRHGAPAVHFTLSVSSSSSPVSIPKMAHALACYCDLSASSPAFAPVFISST